MLGSKRGAKQKAQTKSTTSKNSTKKIIHQQKKRKISTKSKKPLKTPLLSSVRQISPQKSITNLHSSSSLTTPLTFTPLQVFKQQKRKNYSFVTITGPKDDRYLDDGQDWEAPKATVFNETLVFSSLILERPPICLKELPQWEVDWYTYRHAKLTEKAWTLPQDLEKGLYGKISLGSDELPDALPHVTDEDIANNRHSLYRKLEDPTYLICKVKQDFDEKLPSEIWMFPTTQVRAGETIRSAAERTLFYHAGDLDFHTLGNTPILYTPVRNSNILKKEYPEAKIVKNFYMHSMYLGGNVELEPGGEITDYAWVTQEELSEYFNTDHTKELLKLTGSSLYYLHPQ